MTENTITVHFIYAPNNFPLAHRRPQLNDNVIIQYRQSDTMKQGGGYALEAQDLFLGWIRAGDLNAIRSLDGEESGLVGSRGILKVVRWPNIKNRLE
ncbi:hypothetical protein HO173_003332 [Letharia columbiana]|uniref:Uncharacterized protein n=1 Tax=Letharia columbiana TaxID=112416 RepID=A0A8H6G1X3_9LECA|nr:uncharacterized protein HO173_003332 [Letharia columbiana]KAF6238825.1 hypothetical protein HO173_003332 [Letharia columbiana]